MFALQGEIGDMDSNEVGEILGIITKLKFDYVANITAVQFHLKQSDVPLHVKLSDEVTQYQDTKPELASKNSKEKPASKTEIQESPSHPMPLPELLQLIQLRANIFLPQK